MKANATFTDNAGNTLNLTPTDNGGFSLNLNGESFEFENAADVKTATRSFNSTAKASAPAAPPAEPKSKTK